MADAEQAQQAALRARSLVAPALVNALCRGQRDEVTEAVGLLFDYIDALAAPLPAPVIGEGEAFELFRAFVRENAKALRMVAHWGDGRCGALLDVLQTELQGSDRPASSPASPLDAAQTLAPLFPEDGGTEGTA